MSDPCAPCSAAQLKTRRTSPRWWCERRPSDSFGRRSAGRSPKHGGDATSSGQREKTAHPSATGKVQSPSQGGREDVSPEKKDVVVTHGSPHHIQRGVPSDRQTPPHPPFPEWRNGTETSCTKSLTTYFDGITIISHPGGAAICAGTPKRRMARTPKRRQS